MPRTLSRAATFDLEDYMPTGTVKWFNPAKGYGFIQPEDGSKDVFVHISAVERSGLGHLVEGQRTGSRQCRINSALAKPLNFPPNPASTGGAEAIIRSLACSPSMRGARLNIGSKTPPTGTNEWC